jgi:hypothetical protein
MTRHEHIDWMAGIAQMEIHKMAHDAMKHIKRMSEFPTRSAGQKRRRQEEKAARFARHQERHRKIKEKAK